MTDKKSEKDWSKIAENGKVETDIEPLESETAAFSVLEHPDYQALQQQLTDAEKLIHEHKDTVLRLQAELENTRRRSAEERSKAHKYGLQKFAESLLPVADSFEQALQSHAEEEDDEGLQGVIEGVSMTYKVMIDTFEKFSLIQIDPIGEMFDPNLHEAMSTQDSEEPAGTVLVVFQKGYLLHDRVIRPARVVVAK